MRIFRFLSVFKMGIFTMIPSLFLYAISQQNTNLLLFLDNLYQYLPVINLGYENLFEGNLPLINFHQALGMRILEPGFYGFTNIFMATAYLLAKIDILHTNTITMYVYLTFSIGCFAAYNLTFILSKNRTQSFIVTIVYALSPSYFAGDNWYIWNNFFILPLLIYALYLTIRDSSKILLGLAITVCVVLGNIQYATYQIMAISLVSLCLLITNKEKSKVVMLLFYNYSSSIICLLPVIMLYYRMMNNGVHELIDPGTFYVVLSKFILSTFIPANYLQESTYFANSLPGEAGYSSFLIDPLLLLSLAGVVAIFACLVTKTKKNPVFFTLAIATFCVALFFILNMTGHDSFIYNHIFLLPILKEFRFPYKFFFLVPPLLIPTAAFGLNIMCAFFKKHSIRIFHKLLALVFFVLMGIAIICVGHAIKFLASSNGIDQPNYSSTRASLLENNIDYKNFRIAEISEDASRSMATLENYFGANSATTVKTFSAACYSMRPLLSTNDILINLYGPGWYTGVPIPTINIIENKSFNILNVVSRTPIQLLNELGIKYVIYHQENSNIPQVLHNGGLLIKRIIPWYNNSRLIILDGVSSIVSNGDVRINSLNTTTDSISWYKDTLGAATYHVNFVYDNRFTAAYYSSNSNKPMPIAIKKMNYYFEVNVPYSEKGKIIMVAHDALATLVIFISYFMTLIFFIMIFTLCKRKML